MYNLFRINLTSISTEKIQGYITIRDPITLKDIQFIPFDLNRSDVNVQALLKNNDVKNTIFTAILSTKCFEMRRIMLMTFSVKYSMNRLGIEAKFTDNVQCDKFLADLKIAIDYANTRKDIIQGVVLDGFGWGRTKKYFCVEKKIGENDINSRPYVNKQERDNDEALALAKSRGGKSKENETVKILGRIRKVLTGSRGGQYVLVKNVRISLKNAIKMDSKKLNSTRSNK